MKSAPKKKIAVLPPERIGNKVFIRTVAYFYTGEIVALTKETITLAKAAWIPETGRFADAMKFGLFNEVEPYPDTMLVSVNRGAIGDVCDWPHALPQEQK